MSDTQAAMREFRFLDEKRKTSGLLPLEEQRWQELAAHLGIDISQAVGGYWGADGQWYAYPQEPGYDPNAYTQPGYDPNYGYYDPNQYPQDLQQQPPQQAYDPNYGYYDPSQYPQQQQPQAGWDPNAYPQHQQQQPYADPYAQPQPQQGAWPQQPEQWAQQTTPGYPGWDQQPTAPMPAQEPMPEASWQQPAPPPPEPAPVPSGEESSGPMEVGDDEVMEVTDDDVQLLDSTPAPEVVVPKRAPIMGKPFKPIFGSPEKPLTEKRLVPAPPAPAMPQRPFAPLPPAPVPAAPVAREPALDLVADLRSSLEESQPMAKPAYVEPPPPPPAAPPPAAPPPAAPPPAAPPPAEPPPAEPPPAEPPPAEPPPAEPAPPEPAPPPPPPPVLETRVAVPVEEPNVARPGSTEVSIDVDELEPPPPPPPAPAPEPEPSIIVAEPEPLPPPPPAAPPPPEPEPGPSIIVAEEPPPPPPAPSPEPVIEAEVSPLIEASPVVEAEPSIVVSPELGPAVTLPPAPEVGHFAQPPPPRPMDFDVEVDDVAPAPLAPPPLELSGAADDRVELAVTADFLDYSKHEAPPPVPDDAPPEAPVFESATLAQLANQDAMSAVEEPTSPSEAPLALASNADFLAQPELVNTGEAWQRSGPAALEIEANESTDVHFNLPPPQGVPLGSEPDDDTDIITGVVIEEEEPTTGQGVPSQEMFASESTLPEILAVPPPPPVRAPPPPPAPPPAPPPPRAVANPIPPEGPYRPPSNVPGPPVAVGASNFERAGAPLQPEEEHIVVKGEHRVILHTLEGQVKRGAIREADLAGEHLLLDSGGAGGQPERIPRVRVKAIFFMLPAGTKAPSPDGQKVRVTFKDGRQVAGFSKDHKAGGQGFFVVPADNRTNTSRIFIYRHSVQAIAVD